MARNSHRRCFVKNLFLEISQNSQENICARDSFLIKLQANFVKKESLAQIFFCGFCEISKNTFFTEHLRATASLWRYEKVLYLIKSFCSGKILSEAATRGVL